MADIWDQKYQDFNKRCAYCGKHVLADVDAFMGGVLDHIIPSAAHGPDIDENKALACATCNNLKGTYNPVQPLPEDNSKEALMDRARSEIFQKRADKVRQFIRYLKANEKVATSEPPVMTTSRHAYEVRPRKDPRKDKRIADLISDALPFGQLWFDGPEAVAKAIDYAKRHSRLYDVVIRVYDAAGNLIETREHTGDFKEAS